MSQVHIPNTWRPSLPLIIGLLLVLLGGVAWLAIYPHDLETEILRSARDRDHVLVSRVYFPSKEAAPYPTMMLWHGINCTKELMEPLAIELAGQGIAAIATDAGGFGESYPRGYSEQENDQDAVTISNSLAAHPERFDSQHLGVGGHLMGATMALSLASSDTRIRTTLSLGMSADIHLFSPPNLLMGIGLYEQFHSPSATLEMLRQGIGNPRANLRQCSSRDRPRTDDFPQCGSWSCECRSHTAGSGSELGSSHLRKTQQSPASRHTLGADCPIGSHCWRMGR